MQENIKKPWLSKKVLWGLVAFWIFVLGFIQGYIFNGTFREVFWQDHTVDPLTICEIQLERMNEDLVSATTNQPIVRTKDKELRKVLQRNMGIYRNQNR